MMILNLENFTESINSITEVLEANDALEKYLKGDVLEYNAPLIATAVSLLENVMNDKDQWISYWLWELDMGSRSDLMATYENGDTIPLSTVEDLYNLLIDNCAPSFVDVGNMTNDEAEKALKENVDVQYLKGIFGI